MNRLSILWCMIAAFAIVESIVSLIGSAADGTAQASMSPRIADPPKITDDYMPFVYVYKVSRNSTNFFARARCGTFTQREVRHRAEPIMSFTDDEGTRRYIVNSTNYWYYISHVPLTLEAGYGRNKGRD